MQLLISMLILCILGDLADSTKKNIICFTENTGLFSFLSNNNLSFSSSQLEIIPFLNYDIGVELKKAWIKPVSYRLFIIH